MQISSRSSLVYLAKPQRFVIGDCGVPAPLWAGGSSVARELRFLVEDWTGSAPRARVSHGKNIAAGPLVKRFRRFIDSTFSHTVCVRPGNLRSGSSCQLRQTGDTNGGTFTLADWQRILCHGFSVCQDVPAALTQPVYYSFTICIRHVYIWYSQNCAAFYDAYARHERAVGGEV